MTGKISPPACGRRSDADNAPKAACARDRGFETGQKTEAILENSRLNDSSKAARRHPLNRGREKTRVMVGSWRMKAHNWHPSGECRSNRFPIDTRRSVDLSCVLGQVAAHVQNSGREEYMANVLRHRSGGSDHDDRDHDGSGGDGQYPPDDPDLKVSWRKLCLNFFRASDGPRQI